MQLTPVLCEIIMFSISLYEYVVVMYADTMYPYMYMIKFVCLFVCLFAH